MTPIQDLTEILNAFNTYVSSGDKSLIENFTLEDINLALIRKCGSAKQKQKPLCQAMLQRARELGQREIARRQAKERWKDRIFGFLFGLATGLFSQWLAKLLK